VLVNHENEKTVYFADSLVLINDLIEFILVESKVNSRDSDWAEDRTKWGLNFGSSQNFETSSRKQALPYSMGTGSFVFVVKATEA
jgi:hypothetical protein